MSLRQNDTIFQVICKILTFDSCGIRLLTMANFLMWHSSHEAARGSRGEEQGVKSPFSLRFVPIFPLSVL